MSTYGVNVCSGSLRALGAGDVGEHARLAAPEAHRVGLAAAVDLDVEPGGQRVDHRGAHTVQTAGCRVRAAAELPARVQPGVDQLDPGQAGARLDVDRHAAAVVADLDRPVVVQGHLDAVAVPAQRLVDRVVDDLPQAVHEPARVGGADVHAGTLADRLEPLEDLEVVGGVLGRGLGRRGLLRSGRRHVRKGSRRVRRPPTGAPGAARAGPRGVPRTGDPGRPPQGHDADMTGATSAQAARREASAVIDCCKPRHPKRVG